MCVPAGYLQHSDNTLVLNECFIHKRVKLVKLTGTCNTVCARAEVNSAHEFNVTFSPRGQSFMSQPENKLPVYYYNFNMRRCQTINESRYGEFLTETRRRPRQNQRKCAKAAEQTDGVT